VNSSIKITYYSGYNDEALIQFSWKGRPVGNIIFFERNSICLTEQVRRQSDLAYYPISRFSDIFTILRYVQLVGLYVNTESDIGVLQIFKFEPLGEREGV
jgi:hypothetical protein